MKHTPKPWRVRFISDLAHTVLDSEGRCILSFGSSDPTLRKYQNANAHLVAAAPELYQSNIDRIAELKTVISTMPEDSDFKRQLEANLHNAETLHALALGGTP